MVHQKKKKPFAEYTHFFFTIIRFVFRLAQPLSLRLFGQPTAFHPAMLPVYPVNPFITNANKTNILRAHSIKIDR